MSSMIPACLQELCGDLQLDVDGGEWQEAGHDHLRHCVAATTVAPGSHEGTCIACQAQ